MPITDDTRISPSTAAAGQSSMVVGSSEPHMAVGNGLVVNRARGGQILRGRFERLHGQNTGNNERDKTWEEGWGVVRLLREGEESTMPSSLAVGAASSSRAPPAHHSRSTAQEEAPASSLADCTILCISAVPAYMTPSDLLDFVGPETRQAVTHFRMVITEHVARYMVLMKFREAQEARDWRLEWDGRVFNGVEVCGFLAICLVFCLVFWGCLGGICVRLASWVMMLTCC